MIIFEDSTVAFHFGFHGVVFLGYKLVFEYDGDCASVPVDFRALDREWSVVYGLF